MKVVGKAIPHESAREHVTGRALYTDDLLQRYPHLLHAWPVQLPQAHARILELKVSGAYRVPGVVKVLTAADVPGVNDSHTHQDEPLFPSEGMFFGQAVAWVLAESEEAARLGAAQVKVEFEPLPAILTIKEAIAQGSFQGSRLQARRGEVERGLQEAPLRLEGELEIGGQEHFYLETQASLAYLDEAGGVVVHSSTQHPSETQQVVAQVLGLPRNRVVVQCLRMGGGFGGKETQANPYAAVAALGAWLTGRPVRVRLNRSQDITLSGKRHPFYARWKVGFTPEGQLLALKMELYADGGWSLDLSEAVLARAVCHSDNAYFIPHMEVIGRVCKTHKTSQTAFRGFGGPQGMVFIEEVLDRVARTLGLPPEVVRERNFYGATETKLDPETLTTHYGQFVKDWERMHQIWHELKLSSDFAQRRAEIAAFNATHPHLKRGLAITPVKFGISFNLTAFNQAGALVLIYQDGSVQVNHGGTEMGQGLHTKMLQIAAQTLGVPLERVRLMPTRTDKIPNTSATAASSGADLNGGAVLEACQKLKARLAGIAAQEFGVNPADIVFEGGQVWSIWNPTQAVPYTQIVQKAYAQRVQLFADGFYRTPGLHWDKSRMWGKPFHYFAFGAAVAEVEVEDFTGAYRVRRVDLLHDVGDSLSPLVDLGQVEGGFIQGMGWLTLEELRWDAQGQVATRSASTYKLPSFSELPEVFKVRLLPKATEPGVVYGSKAVGEPPLMLALSVREALREAVGAFGEGGVVELASPATPEAVFWAIERVREKMLISGD
ncbi:xanthine dehydrogenase molybdopterin binding subunit [Meiothermus granaticius]|uniref:Putative xanthine dehydrogenase molybdenum-binding subunit XdhA n=1 Tax=Meiothermus granaticius NBRC 107808 TaxID=1227551 RepID=A0A399F674_9DEIN|nr:xanthine dehydrogenase molybdopterin binding subunit [Meiothermus granaticius]MCL6528327.1 xanthine dehydrogenase molybdopterin binding subunit [Thermaceae bacterium]RIH91126.1 putative xanthine dehydrogenase molybdenum-binding subunit XdhA [Meiothermus granaticius NBRC 107808]GEM86723.1 dehydrogenase [Meiothermus granaticius NBRC 107808]